MRVPARLGISLQQDIDLPQQRRRGDRPGQEPKALALTSAQRGKLRLQRKSQSLFRCNDSALQNGARAIRVVEREHRGFGKYVGRAEAGRVLRIAFDLDRASVDRTHDHASSASGQLESRCKLQRLAGNQTFWLSDIRNDLLLRLAAGSKATCDAARQKPQSLPPI